MVDNSVFGPKNSRFSMYSFTYPLQYIHRINLVDSLTLWNEFKVNSALDIEENDEQCLHL
jgi:hypothetical protein